MSGPKTLAPEAIASGEVGKPPAVILPDPGSLFLNHSKRFRALALGHQLEPYLLFLGALCQAQHDCQKGFEPDLPDAGFEPDGTAADLLLSIVTLLRDTAMPEAARNALNDIGNLDEAGRMAMLRTVAEAEVPPENIAGHVFAAAAVQVHFTRLAARLDPLQFGVADAGLCPACGGAPVASAIMELPKASGHRYCCCSLCATLWNVPRIQCVLCGNEKGIAYHNIEGISDTIQAESCDNCLNYVKIFHQEKDPALDPPVDDVASLGLDLLMRAEGFRRGSANPFLLGY